MKGLAIKDVAERTGIAAGTIRMWEQRYGFPEPERTSAGYRLYSEDDVEGLRRVLAYRERGLSVPAAVDRARSSGLSTDRPSLYGVLAAGVAPMASQLLRKRTLIAISRAIEDEAISRAAAPIVVASFQNRRNYRAVEHRYRALARTADAVLAFADFERLGGGGDAPVEVPIEPDDGLGHEWAVVVDAPGYCACLLAWEQPRPATEDVPDRERTFEAMWTLDPHVVRRATQVAATLARRADPALGERMDALLDERPLAMEQPAPGLTAVTNRIVGYLEDA
ncbi:MAG TPA: DICT sensory domain-containing protein [Solirubrobacteraceae bacterium]|nr:DICT sensory domain-containing protein [Solirubrobacteraceae bacterium]